MNNDLPSQELVLVENPRPSRWRRRLAITGLSLFALACLTLALAQRNINQRQARNFDAQVQLLQRELHEVKAQASADQMKLAELTRQEQRRQRIPAQASKALRDAKLIAPKLAKANTPPARR